MSYKVRRAIHSALTACAICTFIPSVASAQAAVRSYSIVQQPLDQALRQFALSNNLDLLFDPEMVAGKISEALEGKYTVDEGLATLLRGSGLQATVSGSRAVINKVETGKYQNSISSSDYSVESASYQRVASAPAEEGNNDDRSSVIGEVVVTSRIITTQNDAFGATKMGLPIAETPFSVIAVTEDMIDIASIRGVGDLYKIDPSGSPTHQDGYGSSRIRGFAGQRRIDGFREGTDVNVELDMVSFDRVELIKGGTSTLYGQTEPGGVVNYVSKLPEMESAVRMRGEIGSHDYYRYEGDLT
ncbi:TonB-dependent receptor, partial [Steroidobacter sp.]|uniref:TonB-dependent receptor n=1 Tax=Steroidobacter sp. TaxID=1978227 RepID=UPI001A4363F5